MIKVEAAGCASTVSFDTHIPEATIERLKSLAAI